MAAELSRYVVGIDLGTSNTVVAYTDTQNAEKSKNTEIKIFEIEQFVQAGEINQRPLLPSIRYHPAKDELPQDQIRLPWADDSLSNYPFLVGEFARELSGKVSGRAVVSAKSWLCHGSVDRTAAILPWGAAEDVEKISPLEASASYLNHIKSYWNSVFPNELLEQQQIVLTVPASFDEMARALTLEAAKECGFQQVRLLEEPQAVCYDWLNRHSDNLHEALQGARLLLVCDVGGGTTDLTLIEIKYHADAEPELVRIGVGEHLMLGGDNLDLAIAHIVERELSAEKKLSTAELAQLIQQCRVAKETLLGSNPPEQFRVTLLGGGSKLIGGARSVTVTREQIKALALDGFFPQVPFQSKVKKNRAALQEFGLPYESDPGITRHVAGFLQHYQEACRASLAMDLQNESAAVPDALLLNGGLFSSELLQQRLKSQLDLWREGSVSVFENGDPDLAVARGAVAAGLAKRGKHLKIESGAARSYFLVLDKDKDQGICLLPSGSEENKKIKLDHQFLLKVGAPVQFDIATSTKDVKYKAGQLVSFDDPASFPALPPLATVMKKRGKMKGAEVEVELTTEVSDIGTMALECVSTQDNNRRWLLQFDLRGELKEAVAVHPNLQQAKEKINLVYGGRSKNIKGDESKKLRGELERLLGKRDDWDTPLLREMFKIFLDGVKRRRRSDSHERLWFSLAGFCLRPGFGYALDDWRIEQVYPLYEQGLQYRKDAKTWAEWWNFWRRVAGGLSEAQQETIYRDVALYLQPVPEKSKAHLEQLKKKSYLAYDDMLRMAAAFENLTQESKIALGEGLLQRLEKKSESPQTWWAIGRIAAREPLYCSHHKLIPVATVEQWLDRVLTADWKSASQAAFAATIMAKKTEDRERDISPDYRSRVIEQLKQFKCSKSWIDMVDHKVALEESDVKRFYGDTLPSGLKLIDRD